MIKIEKNEVHDLCAEGLSDGYFAHFKGSTISFTVFHAERRVYVVEIDHQAYKTEDKTEAIEFYCSFIIRNLPNLEYFVVDGAGEGYLYQMRFAQEDGNSEAHLSKSSIENYWVLDPSDVNKEFLQELWDSKELSYWYFVPHDMRYLRRTIKQILMSALSSCE